MFCALPWSTTIAPEQRSKVFVYLINGSQMVYYIAIGCFIVTMTYQQHSYFDSTLSNVQRVLYEFEYGCGFAQVLLIMLMSTFFKHKMFSILHSMDLSERRLKELGSGVDQSLLLRSAYSHAVTLCLFFTVTVAVDAVYNHCVFVMSIRSSVTYVLPNLISCVAITFFALQLTLTRKQLRCVNDLVRNLAKNKPAKGMRSAETADRMSTDRSTYANTIQEHIKQTKSSDGSIRDVLNSRSSRWAVNVFRDSCPHHELTTKLDVLLRLHAHLCANARRSNSYHAIMTLITIAGSFMILNVQAYNSYRMISFRTPIGNASLACYTALWIVLHAGKIAWLVRGCSETSKEMGATGSLLHQIQIDPNDIALSQTMQRYSLQLLSQNTTLSACGFISLNYGLLTSIIGALTTYLVILIQFDVSDEARRLRKGTSILARKAMQMSAE